LDGFFIQRADELLSNYCYIRVTEKVHNIKQDEKDEEMKNGLLRAISDYQILEDPM